MQIAAALILLSQACQSAAFVAPGPSLVASSTHRVVHSSALFASADDDAVSTRRDMLTQTLLATTAAGTSLLLNHSFLLNTPRLRLFPLLLLLLLLCPRAPALIPSVVPIRRHHQLASIPHLLLRQGQVVKVGFGFCSVEELV